MTVIKTVVNTLWPRRSPTGRRRRVGCMLKNVCVAACRPSAVAARYSEATPSTPCVALATDSGNADRHGFG